MMHFLKGHFTVGSKTWIWSLGYALIHDLLLKLLSEEAKGNQLVAVTGSKKLHLPKVQIPVQIQSLKSKKIKMFIATVVVLFDPR